MRDQTWVAHVREHNAAWLARIATEVRALGIDVVPSVANFYLLRFPVDSGMDANGAAAFLIANGIIPRPVGSQPGQRELRITVGTDEENETVLDTLARYVRGER